MNETKNDFWGMVLAGIPISFIATGICWHYLGVKDEMENFKILWLISYFIITFLIIVFHEDLREYFVDEILFGDKRIRIDKKFIVFTYKNVLLPIAVGVAIGFCSYLISGQFVAVAGFGVLGSVFTIIINNR